MKPIAFLLFMLLNSIAFGQNFYFSLASGINFPLVISTKNPDYVILKSENKKQTYMPSIGVGYKLNNFLSIKSGLAYEERGFYGKTFTLDIGNGATGGLTKTDFFYSFLTMPLVIEIKAGNRIQFFVNGGMNTSLRIGGATKINDKNSISLAFIHPEDKSPTWDFSWTAGAGLRIKISDKLKLIGEGNYYKSFTPIGTREPIERVIFHNGYRISIGVEFYVNTIKK